MATKTKSKAATKKPAAHKPAKAALSHKSSAKAKTEKKAKVESHAKTAPIHQIAAPKKIQAHPVAPKTEKPAPTARRGTESVSLIDGKQGQKKLGDGEM